MTRSTKPSTRSGRHVVYEGKVALGEKGYAKKSPRSGNRAVFFERGLSTKRLNEITDLVIHRPPHKLPDTDDISEYLYIVAQTLVWRGADALQTELAAWCEGLGGGPDDLDDEIVRIARRAKTTPRKLSAETCGRKLGLTPAEREALRITTMRAVGQGPDQQKARKRERERLRQAAKRRANGATPRSESIAVKARAAGISRMTWYRRLRRQPVTLSLPAPKRTNGNGVNESVTPAMGQCR